jgi:hypothetical protein
MSEPSLLVVFLSSVWWSSSSSSRCSKRLILSSVKHYKGIKVKKTLNCNLIKWKLIHNDVHRW